MNSLRKAELLASLLAIIWALAIIAGCISGPKEPSPKFIPVSREAVVPGSVYR